MLIVAWAVEGGSISITGFPMSNKGMTFESLIMLADGEQFPIIFPLSTSNAWQKRDTSQDRERPSQM